MKKSFFIFLLSAVCAIVSGQDKDWAQFYRYAAANDTLHTSGTKVQAVIMGDSITDNWLKFDRAFFTGRGFAGRGISGQVTSQMLVRFRDDVIDLHPKYVVILAGINDIAMNQGPISLEHIFGNIVSMCELAKALNAMIKAYADANRHKYVDFWTALANEEGGLDEDKAPDGVHPNLHTYKIMEEMLVKAIF